MVSRNNGECSCSKPNLGPEGICQNCGLQISSDQIEDLQEEIDNDFESVKVNSIPEPKFGKPVSAKTSNAKPASNSSYTSNPKISSKDAARRTLKYATLFEDIGRFNQYFNTFIAVIAEIYIVVSKFETTFKLITFAGILILWWIFYIQTSLIRGIASYFQMKASAHLENS